MPRVGVSPANAPEAWMTDAMPVDWKSQPLTLCKLSIDRADWTRKLVRQRDDSLTIYGKAWPVRHRQGWCPKTALTLDGKAQTVCCPHPVTMPCRPGRTVRFPAKTGANGPLQDPCTTSNHRRRVSIHPDDAFLPELRERQATPQGRAKLREWVSVEQALAQIDAGQGDRTRYRTLRKKLFDLRRMAVVHNLHILARMTLPLSQAAV